MAILSDIVTVLNYTIGFLFRLILQQQKGARTRMTRDSVSLESTTRGSSSLESKSNLMTRGSSSLDSQPIRLTRGASSMESHHQPIRLMRD